MGLFSFLFGRRKDGQRRFTLKVLTRRTRVNTRVETDAENGTFAQPTSKTTFSLARLLKRNKVEGFKVYKTEEFIQEGSEAETLRTKTKVINLPEDATFLSEPAPYSFEVVEKPPPVPPRRPRMPRRGLMNTIANSFSRMHAPRSKPTPPSTAPPPLKRNKAAGGNKSGVKDKISKFDAGAPTQKSNFRRIRSRIRRNKQAAAKTEKRSPQPAAPAFSPVPAGVPSFGNTPSPPTKSTFAPVYNRNEPRDVLSEQETFQQSSSPSFAPEQENKFKPMFTPVYTRNVATPKQNMPPSNGISSYSTESKKERFASRTNSEKSLSSDEEMQPLSPVAKRIQMLQAKTPIQSVPPTPRPAFGYRAPI